MTTKHRRRVLKLVATAGTVALAGCSDGGSNGDDGGESTVTTTGPADGEVASNAIEGLAVVMLESQATDVFSVTVTLENTGDERTSAMNYTYTLALFDGDGTELGTVVANRANLGAQMAPGQQGSVIATPQFSGLYDLVDDPREGQQGSVIATPQFYDGEPGDVARYELTLTCETLEGEDRGVYCP